MWKLGNVKIWKCGNELQNWLGDLIFRGDNYFREDSFHLMIKYFAKEGNLLIFICINRYYNYSLRICKQENASY